MIESTNERPAPLPADPANLRGAPAGATPEEFRGQLELDALLRMQAGDLTIRPGLVSRIRRAAWSRRLHRLVEMSAAAVIVICLGVCYMTFISQPRQPGDRPNETRDTQSNTPDGPAATQRTEKGPTEGQGSRGGEGGQGGQGGQPSPRPTVPPPPSPPGAGAPPMITPGSYGLPANH